jgi:hypothetical protein
MTAENEQIEAERANLEMDQANLERWMRGNKAAMRFCETLFFVLHLWDDLIDLDKDRAPQHINNAFWLALIELPSNPFYIDNFMSLHPLLISIIHDWHAANEFEQDNTLRSVAEDEHCKNIAFTLRCNALSIIQQCAFLCGGHEWAKVVGPEIRLYGQRETLEQYKEDLCQT